VQSQCWQRHTHCNAAAVHAEAGRLAELYSDGDVAIEEVEVELVDIFRASRDTP
jgi:hypothetical protein